MAFALIERTFKDSSKLSHYCWFLLLLLLFLGLFWLLAHATESWPEGFYCMSFRKFFFLFLEYYGLRLGSK